MALAVLIPRLVKHFPRAWIFLAPALVVTLEFLMPQIFPYMQGLSHFRVNPVYQLASITGVYGISYLLFFSNCVFYHALDGFRRKRTFYWKPLLLLMISVILVLGYGWWRGVQYRQKSTQVPTLTVGLIQSNITPHQHRKMGFQQIHQLYLDMSREAVSRGADWIIWSEGEFKPHLNSPVAREILERDSRELGRPLLLGGFHMKYKNGRRFPSNSAIQVDPETGLGRRYDKRMLVPFGEYLPFEKQLSFIYRHLSRRQVLYSGKDPVVQKLQDIPYAFLICYEAIFPSLVRESVRAGAHLLVNITYDAWFGRTSAPYQHLMLATARSVENGIPLVRLGTTGISTVIDALGRTGKQSELFQPRVLLYPVKLVRLPSLYTRIGNLFSWICVLFTVLGLIHVIIKPALPRS
ncbi:MAG: apolipoprotein N-acyltransferase, partial [Candidatus Aminicenantes bacterium]|nr:apolipoprotein N-acyltransferase [Candidatus Aminicenantes bacterium]